MTDDEYDAMVDEERLTTITRLERELAEARATNEGLLRLYNTDVSAIRGERDAAVRRSKRAARWFYDAGFWSEDDSYSTDDGESFDAAWSRYQQERKEQT